eukprot:765151-Hanusia_phi.AAC.3
MVITLSNSADHGLADSLLRTAEDGGQPIDSLLVHRQAHAHAQGCHSVPLHLLVALGREHRCHRPHGVCDESSTPVNQKLRLHALSLSDYPLPPPPPPLLSDSMLPLAVSSHTSSLLIACVTAEPVRVPQDFARSNCLRVYQSFVQVRRGEERERERRGEERERRGEEERRGDEKKHGGMTKHAGGETSIC